MAPARTRWRAFAEDAEVGVLVDHVVVAQRDAAVARASLERLLALCRPVAEQIARTYVRSDDVSEMVQESLVAAARHLPELRDPRAFPYWFARLAHNACRQWLRGAGRHRKRRLAAPVGGADEAPWEESLGLPDPHADAAIGAVETRDALVPLLRLLPPRERRLIARAYLDDQPQREIARREGISPKAVESLLYRGIRRLRTVAAQCGAEAQELALWCPECGRRRLAARLEPGDGQDWPLRVRATCSGCAPGYYGLGLPLARYPTLEGALLDGMAGLGAELVDVVRAPAPRCGGCGGPLTVAPGSDVLERVSWSCRRCLSYGVCGLSGVAAGLPAWRAFWEATPRLRLGPARAVERGGEARVELTAWDAASGRTATLALARDTLAVRDFTVVGG